MANGLIHTAHRRARTLMMSESAVILAAVAASAYVRVGSGAWPSVIADILPKALFITSVSQLCLYYSDLYDDPQAGGNKTELLIRTLRALGTTLLILAVIYTLYPPLIVAPGVLAPAAALSVAAVIAWRVVFWWAARQVAPRERVLLVGTTASAFALAHELHRRREELGVQLVGYVENEATPHDASGALPLLGTIEDIPALVRARSVDRVVVSLADARGKLPMDKLLEMKLDGVTFDHLTSLYEEYTGKIAVENLRPSWLIFSAGFRKTQLLLPAKRALDVVCGAIGLLLATPIVLALAAVVKATSPGPALFSQRRVGRDGRVFTVYKLRSMCADAERHTGPVWTTSRADARITPIGRLMRRTRLDELPQFWNILIGHMSLVGPRPERPEFVQSLIRQIPFYGLRHVVKPGLTGWAQVRYTYGASVEDAVEKLQYDLFYIKHMSIALDLFIAFETVKTVLLRRGQ